MSEILAYGDDPLQTIKVFQKRTSNDTIVFIHGGGWRDPSNSYDDFLPLVAEFSNQNVNLVSINYRLSPRVSTQAELDALPSFRHPLHLVDVSRALEYLHLHKYRIVLLVGHSVGATLSLQLLNFRKVVDLGIKHIQKPVNLPTDTELQRLETAMAALPLTSIYLVDGIYDVSSLIEEYGDDYRTFVRCAFDSDQHSRDSLPLSSREFDSGTRSIGTSTKIHILHSTQDELISRQQSNLLDQYLTEQGIPHEIVFEPWGKHEEVYTRKELAHYIIEHREVEK